MKKITGTKLGRILYGVATLVACICAAVLTARLLMLVFLGTGSPPARRLGKTDAAVMDHFDVYVTNQISGALDGLVTVKKVYLLNDEDLVAPEPDGNCFGQTEDPAQLQWLLDEAKELLEVENTLFSVQTVIKEDSEVRYYLDETIFVVSWKQVINDTVYNISEVKIAHPSQFRRFLADGTYGSAKQYTATELATTVNAVVASAGDFYKFRPLGIIVNDGIVYRAEGTVDTCFIDDQGELILLKRGEIWDKETAQRYVDEHNIRFSLAFGPVLVENGEVANIGYYPLGQPYGEYSRAALAQMGELHYLLVTANFEGHSHVPTITELAKVMASFGCEKAYALDGGQTATIVMNDSLFNIPDYGAERKISDIIYFATALPDE